MSTERKDQPSSSGAAAPGSRPAPNTLKDGPVATTYFDLPPNDVITIPDVAAFVTRVRTHGMDPVTMNRNITRGYAQFARVFQAILDPTFARSGTPPRSTIRPVWFAFAPHASDEAGKGIVSVAFANSVLDVLEGEAPPSDIGKVFAQTGMDPASKVMAQRMAGAARLAGMPLGPAMVVAALLTGSNSRVFEDPRTLAITIARVVELFGQAPGGDPLHKAESIVDTLGNTLAEGNLGIYSDVGGTAQAYLEFRRAVGAPSPEDVLGRFVPPGSNTAEARRAYAFALQHGAQRALPTDFERLLAGVSGASIMVAGLALYEQARLEADAARRDWLISFGNNFVAYREQHDVVAPVFVPPRMLPGEVSRSAVMRTFTPPLRLGLGDGYWNFSDWARRRPDRDGNFLTSQATEYNWAVFADRWPALLDAFQLGYRNPAGLWRLPSPPKGS
ncbi:MAG TPA: hypothetical protein VK447_10010 [Myxococcaceae bacterium]|nr:hypothetical protein [Myxococcaceae bacterium]